MTVEPLEAPELEEALQHPIEMREPMLRLAGRAAQTCADEQLDRELHDLMNDAPGG